MGKIPIAGPHTEGRTLRRADYLGGDVLLPAVQRTVTNYLNRAAFAAAPNARRGDSGVGIVGGQGCGTFK